MGGTLVAGPGTPAVATKATTARRTGLVVPVPSTETRPMVRHPRTRQVRRSARINAAKAPAVPIRPVILRTLIQLGSPNGKKE